MPNLFKVEGGNILIGIEKCGTSDVQSTFNRLISQGFRGVSEDQRAWYWVAPETPGRRIFAGLIAQDERVRNPTASSCGKMGLW